MLNNLTHERTLDSLVDRLLKYHPRKEIYTHKEYRYNQRIAGEIDCYVFTKDRRLMLFEVKSSNSLENYREACDQLRRAHDLYFKNVKYKSIAAFYVTPNRIVLTRNL